MIAMRKMKKLQIEWMFERSHKFPEDAKLLQILDNNFTSILIRTASFFPDPWTIAQDYLSITKNLKFIIAVNPASIHPVFCAIKISTLQKKYGDRISINLVSGASTVEQSIYSDNIKIESRYRRTAEYAEIIKKLVIDGRIDSFNGEFYNLNDVDILQGMDFELVFAGSSDDTINLANNFGSCHYYSMETLEQYQKNRDKIIVESAIKTTIIVDKDSQKAWGFADSLLENVTELSLLELKKDLSSHESQNQKRQQRLHNFSKENLKVDKNIWSGMGLLRGGGITAMVGDFNEVANLIEEFYNSGLNRILIGGSPEHIYIENFVNGVIPILQDKNIL